MTVYNISKWMTSVTTALNTIIQKVDQVASVDAEIQAATATLVSDNATLKSLITQVLAEIAGGEVQPSTLEALQAAVSDDDTTVQGFSGDVNPPAPTTPTPDPAS
jgi:hypothetical protein